VWLVWVATSIFCHSNGIWFILISRFISPVSQFP